MKVLVTGANGYLGTGVVKFLLDDGIDVIATDFKTELVDSRAIRIDADLFQIENPYSFFGEPDILLHLAWKNGFNHNEVSHIKELPYHYSFIENLVNSNIKKICILGTIHEIGFYEGCVNENTRTNPLSLYGIGKNALRQSIELICKKNNKIFQWLRGYYIVGNTDNGCSIFSKITQAVKDGEKEFPFTKGENQFDFLDYEDFCMQVASVIEQDNIVGIINCCLGFPLRLSERVERFIKDNSYDIKLIYGAFPDRPYDSKAIWGDSSKILKIIQDKVGR